MSKVLVIGDGCEDVYEYGQCRRLNPEAPVPVFEPSYTYSNGGMARNVHSNLVALGVDTTIHTNKEMVTKKRLVEQKTNYILLRIDTGDSDVTRAQLPGKNYFKQFDAVVVSDYNKGFLLEQDIETICNSHDLVFVDTKKTLGTWLNECSFIKINEKEYNDSKNLISEELQSKIITTLSERGCVYQGRTYPVDNVEVKDLAGAGDTFLAGLVSKYLETGDIDTSIKYANACATCVVQKKGVSVIKLEEIESEI